MSIGAKNIAQLELCLHYVRIFHAFAEFAVWGEHESAVFADGAAVTAVGFAVVGRAENDESLTQFIRLVSAFGIGEKVVESAYPRDPVAAREIRVGEYIALSRCDWDSDEH